jgi:hypothetical protein
VSKNAKKKKGLVELIQIGSSTIMYLRKIPKAVPSGFALVHNSVRPLRTLGLNGFRAWLEKPCPNDRIEICDCAWAPELGEHYRVIKARLRAARAEDSRK